MENNNVSAKIRKKGFQITHTPSPRMVTVDEKNVDLLPEGLHDHPTLLGRVSFKKSDRVCQPCLYYAGTGLLGCQVKGVQAPLPIGLKRLGNVQG
jgi:hypothetical protein